MNYLRRTHARYEQPQLWIFIVHYVETKHIELKLKSANKRSKGYKNSF